MCIKYAFLVLTVILTLSCLAWQLPFMNTPSDDTRSAGAPGVDKWKW